MNVDQELRAKLINILGSDIGADKEFEQATAELFKDISYNYSQCDAVVVSPFDLLCLVESAEALINKAKRDTAKEIYESL